MLVTALQEYSIEMWKSRSESFHSTHPPLAEQATRSESFSLLQQLRMKTHLLPAANRNLLNKKRRFFEKASLRLISGWSGRIHIALQQKQKNR